MPPQRAKVGRREAYEFLRSRIVRLELPPGSAISENEAGAALGVSRTPVREAMMLLAEEGLLEVVPQVGTFVSRVDHRRVREAQFLREAVELASLRSIEGPLDEQLLAALRTNLEQQDAVAEDLEAFFELDEAFHRGLMALAGHESSWATVAAAKTHLDRARRLGIKQQDSSERFIAEHRAIFAALTTSDMAAAEDLLRAHVRVIFEHIEAVHAEHPELFVGDPDARPVRRSVVVWE